MKKLEILALVLIILITFFFRLYKLSNPIADWHSWRQADTAAVARNYIKEKSRIFYPQSDSLTALNEYGLENPNRYFINEFPLYNLIVAFFYGQFEINPEIARLVSIVFVTLGAFFLYLFARKLFGIKIAFLSTFFYAVNPFNIYYGRVIMPDPLFLSLSIISLFLALVWIETKKISYCLTLALIFSLAMLVKPYAIFLYIPIIYWLAINWKISLIKNVQTYIFIFGSIIPLLLWRIHVANHPEGTFATSWLFDAGNIRFTGAYFRWLIFERLNKLIFATGAFVLLIIGIAKSYQTKNGSLLFIWLLGIILYMIIFAKGNVTHDFYQLPLMPVSSILVALGFFALIDFSKKFYAKLFNTILAVSLLIISLAFGWYEVRGFFNINNPAIVIAGQRADRLLPKDALVIAPYDDDPSFLYQTNRYGYTKIDKPLEKYVAEGVNYLVSVDTADPGIQNLVVHCKVIEQTNEYVIVEMFKECIGK